MFYIPTPERCDNCGLSFKKAHGTPMFDAATKRGPWGCFCEDCYKQVRKFDDLGVGKGQRYERRDDGRFWITEGAAGLDVKDA